MKLFFTFLMLIGLRFGLVAGEMYLIYVFYHNCDHWSIWIPIVCLGFHCVALVEGIDKAACEYVNVSNSLE